jgi:hypothetical protein
VYHYVCANPAGFCELRCQDPKAMGLLDAAITNYTHFHMSIAAQVSAADATRKALTLTLDSVKLNDANGQPLIAQKAD